MHSAAAVAISVILWAWPAWARRRVVGSTRWQRRHLNLTNPELINCRIVDYLLAKNNFCFSLCSLHLKSLSFYNYFEIVYARVFKSGANPTIASYNATGSLSCFENKNILV
jgi:hypothetical protein